MNKNPLYVKDHGFYQKALELAENGEHRVRVGCIAAVGNKLIAGGFNTYRNDPRLTDFGNATYHAEQNVLNMVPARLLDKVTLYIARIKQNGEPVASEPCNRCKMKLKGFYSAHRNLSKIDSVVYLDKNYNLVKERVE